MYIYKKNTNDLLYNYKIKLEKEIKIIKLYKKMHVYICIYLIFNNPFPQHIQLD